MAYHSPNSWPLSKIWPNYVADDDIIPTVILIGYLRLEATFTGNVKKKMKETVGKLHSKSEAGLNILEFQVRRGKNVSSESRMSKDAVAFDEQTETLSISSENSG